MPLTTGKMPAGRAAHSLITVFKAHDKFVTAALFRRGDDFFIACTLSAHADVVHHREVKEIVVLRHIGNTLRTLRQRKRTDVHAAEVDFSVPHVPERGDKPRNGGFSTAGGTDESVDSPRFDAQADAVQYLLVMVGKPYMFQLDGVIGGQFFGFFRAMHILARQHLRHLTDDDTHLCDIVGIGKGGDERLHNAEGKHDDGKECLRRERAMHIKQTAHRKNAEQRRGEYRHACDLTEQTAAHPIYKAVRALFGGGNELRIACFRLPESFYDLNAADVFHGGVVERFCRGDGALKLLIVAAEHGHKAENAERQDDKHGKSHAPVLDEQYHKNRQRADDVGGHFRQQMGERRFDGIDALDDDVFVRAGGTIQHRTQRQRGQLVEQPCAGVGKHTKCGMVGKRSGDAVQHIAQYPEARHPRTEHKTAGQLRRAVHQRGDYFDDDKIRYKRAGDAEQRRENTQGIFAPPALCQLHQPRGGGTLLFRGFVHG